MTTTCTMILGDCLEVMPTLPKASAEMVFADFPYGITANIWDRQITLATVIDAMWAVTAPKASCVMSAASSFAAQVISALGDRYRYDLVWDKTRVSGFLRAYSAPLRRHEWLIVAGNPKATYNIIKTIAPHGRLQNGQRVTSATKTTCYSPAIKPKEYVYTKERFPTSIITAKYSHKERGLHPTQKPVALLDWLIRTYSNSGDMVLDPTSGSGTTAVSAAQNGRNVTCVEKDETYFELSVERVRKHVRDNLLDVKIEIRR